MVLFNDGQMTEMTAFFVGLACKDDVTILRSTRTPDGQRGSRETFSEHETVKCLVVIQGSSRLEQIAQQTVARSEDLFCFPPGTDVRRTDRLSYAGDTYEIIDLFDPTTYTVFLRVLAKHMQAGAGS